MSTLETVTFTDAPLLVHKYGGTSVATVERIATVADYITSIVASGKSLVVVVSAMGQYTDELIDMAQKLSPEPSRRELDMLLTAGERVSMALLAIALSHRGVTSVSLTGSQSGILTDETHGNARIIKISGDRIKSALKDKKVVIVAGFQGVSPKTKDITTLGRGGSDLTAIALASVLNAPCEILKDVDGVMTADPRVVKEATVVPNLSWEAMAELTWGGSPVLHARSVHVALRNSVKLCVRSSFNIHASGTILSKETPVEDAVVVGISGRRDIVVARSVFKGGKAAGAAMGTMVHWLWDRGEVPFINREEKFNADTIVTQVISAKVAPGYKAHLTSTCKDVVEVTLSPQVATITLAGQGFLQEPDMVAGIRDELGDHSLLFEVRSNAVCAVVPADQQQLLTNKLHHRFVERK